MATNGNGGGNGLPVAPVRAQRNSNHQQQLHHQVDYGAPESMVRHTNSANCSVYHTHGSGDCEQSIASARAAAISSEATSQRNFNFNFNAAAARQQQQVSAAGGHFNTAAAMAPRTRPIESTNNSQATTIPNHQQFQAQLVQNHTAGHYAAKHQQSPMNHHQNYAHLGNPSTTTSTSTTTNNNNYHHYHAPRPTAATNRRNRDQMSCPYGGEEQEEDSHEQDHQDYEHELRFRHEQYDQQDHYASQLRKSQQQHRIGLHQHQASSRQQLQQANAASYSASGQSASSLRRPQASQQQQQQQQQQQLPTSSTNMSNNTHFQQQAKEAPHVNFNRSSQKSAGFTLGGGGGGDDDDESGETTRKKKYLTAKYGQQQMNLIKKRLKIEMWLHEQLQELAKQSKSAHQDEVDEIDIDLDQLLDMDDDQTRRHWLKKTLAPLSDLPSESIEKFVCDVLEQSKLL